MTENSEQIWFLPQRFWEVTKTMPREDADELMGRVIALAERRELEALRVYTFVHFGTPGSLKKAS